MTQDGILKVYYPNAKFGFVTVDGGYCDIFHHLSDNPIIAEVDIGEQVTFDLVWDRRKRKYKGVHLMRFGTIPRDMEFSTIYSLLKLPHPEEAGWITAHIVRTEPPEEVTLFLRDKRRLWAYAKQIIELEKRWC